MNADTKAKILAAAIAAGHSAWITFIAILGGLTVDAYTNGAHSISDYLSYYQLHVLGWIVANLIAPSVRATIAARKGTSNDSAS